jgi:hypothetical protein
VVINGNALVVARQLVGKGRAQASGPDNGDSCGIQIGCNHLCSLFNGKSWTSNIKQTVRVPHPNHLLKKSKTKSAGARLFLVALSRRIV